MWGTKSKMKSLVPIFECIMLIYYALASMWGRHTGARVYSGSQKTLTPCETQGSNSGQQACWEHKVLYLLNHLDPQFLIC